MAKSRDIVDVSHRVWMSYFGMAGAKYQFKLRIISTIEIINYPLIDIGVSWIDEVDPAMWVTQAEALLAAPRYIDTGSEFPRTNLSGTWLAPENLLLDSSTAFTRTSPGKLAPLTVIDWANQNFFEANLYYIPVLQEPAVPPASMPGYDRVDVPDNGTYFTPQKSNWFETEITIARRNTIVGDTTAIMRLAGVFHDVDLPLTHIWVCYTQSYPIPAAGEPYVRRPGSWAISNALPNWEGYHTWYYMGGGGQIYQCLTNEAIVNEYQPTFFWYPGRPVPPVVTSGFIPQGFIFPPLGGSIFDFLSLPSLGVRVLTAKNP